MLFCVCADFVALPSSLLRWGGAPLTAAGGGGRLVVVASSSRRGQRRTTKAGRGGGGGGVVGKRKKTLVKAHRCKGKASLRSKAHPDNSRLLPKYG